MIRYILIVIFMLISSLSMGQIINWRAGVDVSKHQGKIDWNNLDTNIDFVYIKATEGGDFVDKKFKENWNGCKIKKGAYHFFNPKTDPNKQMKNFLGQYKPKKGDLIPVIDVEKVRSWNRRNAKKYTDRLETFIKLVHKECGVYPIIYTNGKFWEDYVNPNFNSPLPGILWIADYRIDKVPYTGPFEEWEIWQWTCKGKVKGIKGSVDLNWARHFEEMILK